MRDFLSICGPIRYENGIATGTLDFTRYADWRVSNPAFLLVEGVNQFCVRVGRNTLRGEDGTAPRVLPVAIKRLEVASATMSTCYQIAGSGMAFGNTTRVSVTVSPLDPADLAAYDTREPVPSPVVARAEVVVAGLKVEEQSHAA